MIPKNMVSVTATLTRQVGSVTTSYTTTLLVQTHKIPEIEETARMAWKQTFAAEQASLDFPLVPEAP